MLYTLIFAQAMPSPYLHTITVHSRQAATDALRERGLDPGLGFTEWAAAGVLGPWHIMSVSGLPVAVVVRS